MYVDNFPTLMEIHCIPYFFVWQRKKEVIYVRTFTLLQNPVKKSYIKNHDSKCLF
jgi:hypothetical protein